MFGIFKKKDVLAYDESWRRGSGTYVYVFRKELLLIAQELEAKGVSVLRSVYSPERKCAEILTAPDGRTVARIRVEGEMCAPTSAYITLANLPPSAEDIFRYRLWPLRVEFKHVSIIYKT